MSTITKITESTATESTSTDTDTDTTEPTGVDPTSTATWTPKEEQLWAALTATPGSTCKELAMAAGIGQSTAAKILAGWAKEGTAAKATAAGPGRKGRAPERWFPADTDATLDAATTDAGSVSEGDAADDPAQRMDDRVPDDGEGVDTPMTAGPPESADDASPNAASPAHVADPPRPAPRTRPPTATLATPATPTGGPSWLPQTAGLPEVAAWTTRLERWRCRVTACPPVARRLTPLPRRAPAPGSVCPAVSCAAWSRTSCASTPASRSDPARSGR